MMKKIVIALVAYTWVIVVGAAETLPKIETKEPPISNDLPNIIVVLLDDVGMAAASPFGGIVPTPTYQELAEQGIRYNRFHTTAMCSPTRAALLTGRNHHRVGMGSITNLAYGEPGYNSVIPDTAATIADVLKTAGYKTAWFGKNHITPEWEVTQAGPFSRWPSGLGFDYFYGFMGGATDQFSPDLVENTLPIDPPKESDFILDKGIGDKAISWLQQNHNESGASPFMMYIAPGTAHVPLQAPKAWIDKFKGQFDQGWDSIRQQIFDRQKSIGVIPANTRMSERPASIPAWSELSVKERQVASRFMEVFAAQLAHFDFQFGRIIEQLKRQGDYDNTLILYIDGDNGADGAAGIYGNLIEGLNGYHADTDYMFEHIDSIGGPHSFAGFNSGWAWAMSTPFRYTKTIASDLGGIRNGLVASWPKGIKGRGRVNTQFLHVTDIAPTIYAAAGISAPSVFKGTEQLPLDGESFAETFDADHAEKPRSQYFEMLGNRSFYKDGWLAATKVYSPQWQRAKQPNVNDYGWELYNIEQDFAQTLDVSHQNAQKLDELVAGFHQAARNNNVYPLDNFPPRRLMDRSLRPYPTQGKTTFNYQRTDKQLPHAGFPDIKNRAWQMRYTFNTQSNNDSGVLITQGGYDNGWGLFLFEGKAKFVYKTNNLPGMQLDMNSSQVLAEGKHYIELHVVPDDKKLGGGASFSLNIDGQETFNSHIDATVRNAFPFAEGVGIGRDFATELTNDYSGAFRFKGEVIDVEITLL